MLAFETTEPNNVESLHEEVNLLCESLHRAKVTHTHAVTCHWLTHRLAPQDGSILWDPLVVLVWQDHRQEEGILLCIRPHVVLMNYRMKGESLSLLFMSLAIKCTLLFGLNVMYLNVSNTLQMSDIHYRSKSSVRFFWKKWKLNYSLIK